MNRIDDDWAWSWPIRRRESSNQYIRFAHVRQARNLVEERAAPRKKPWVKGAKEEFRSVDVAYQVEKDRVVVDRGGQTAERGGAGTCWPRWARTVAASTRSAGSRTRIHGTPLG